MKNIVLLFLIIVTMTACGKNEEKILKDVEKVDIEKQEEIFSEGVEQTEKHQIQIEETIKKDGKLESLDTIPLYIQQENDNFSQEGFPNEEEIKSFDSEKPILLNGVPFTGRIQENIEGIKIDATFMNGYLETNAPFIFDMEHTQVSYGCGNNLDKFVLITFRDGKGEERTLTFHGSSSENTFGIEEYITDLMLAMKGNHDFLKYMATEWEDCSKIAFKLAGVKKIVYCLEGNTSAPSIAVGLELYDEKDKGTGLFIEAGDDGYYVYKK